MIEPLKRAIVRMFVGRALTIVQFVVMATLAASLPFRRPTWPAMTMVVFGILLAGWAVTSMGWRKMTVWPEPKDGTEIVCVGPYAYIRHPMYAAALVSMAGLALHGGGWVRWSLWFLLVIVLLAKGHLEEWYLRRKCPEYAGYAARTWRWLPGVW